MIGMGALIALLHFACDSQAKGIFLEFTREQDLSSGVPIYRLVFRDNAELVAERIYQGGRTLLSQGEIPNNIANITTAKIIKGHDPECKDGKQGIVYLYRDRVVAERIYEKGKSRCSGQIPDGIVVEHYEDGRIRNIFTYRNETRNGPSLSLYQNGSMRGETLYKDGYPVGIGRRYYENGNLMTEWESINGRQTFHKECYENGRLREEIYYKGDEIKTVEYDIHGNILRH